MAAVAGRGGPFALSALASYHASCRKCRLYVNGTSRRDNGSLRIDRNDIRKKCFHGGPRPTDFWVDEARFPGKRAERDVEQPDRPQPTDAIAAAMLEHSHGPTPVGHAVRPDDPEPRIRGHGRDDAGLTATAVRSSARRLFDRWPKLQWAVPGGIPGTAFFVAKHPAVATARRLSRQPQRPPSHRKNGREPLARRSRIGAFSRAAGPKTARPCSPAAWK